ncbi:MAG TPA: endo-1,4-beta-xylanase [Terracidiphilus sp.]|jgi:endo-1,4-beta-xylanase
MPSRREFIAKGAQAAAAIGAAGSAASLLAGCAHHMAIPASLPASFHDVSGPRSLRSHARRHGLVFGSAVIIHNVQSDPDFAELIGEQCGIVVPAGELKWIALRPAPDRYDFSRPDFLLAFAESHHMLMRGHTLCWHESVPDWIRLPKNRSNTRQFFVDHITTVCKHYAGKLQSWDVVNEAILPTDGQPGGLRKSFWYEQIGPDYIDLAFRTARAADPQAKLTYNDYGVEFDNDNNAERRRLILELLRGMQKRGVPLDAVGIQSHIKAAQSDTFGKGLADYIEAIRQMGLEVYLTEMDVNEDDIATNDPAKRDAIIAQTYTDYLRVALANPAVKIVLTWDLSDRFTWLNSGPTHHRKQPNRPQRSLPFDSDYRPKDAFFAIRNSFDRRAVA